MTLAEYVKAIEIVQERPIEEGSAHWLKLAERYADLLQMIQSRSPALVAEPLLIYPQNNVSRRLFADETGIILPKTQKGTRQALTEYVGRERAAEHLAELDRKAEAGRKAEEERRAEAERKRLAAVAERFRAGDFIDASDFLEIARQLGADVHPRTAGSIKKVKSISKEGSYYRMGRYPNVKLNGNTILPLVQMLLGEPQPETESETEEDALARQLFTPGGTNIPSLVA